MLPMGCILAVRKHQLLHLFLSRYIQMPMLPASSLRKISWMRDTSHLVSAFSKEVEVDALDAFVNCLCTPMSVPVFSFNLPISYIISGIRIPRAVHFMPQCLPCPTRHLCLSLLHNHLCPSNQQCSPALFSGISSQMLLLDISAVFTQCFNTKTLGCYRL